MADSKDSLEEKVLAAAFRGEAPKQSEPSQSELPASDESKDDSLKQQVLSAAFKNQTPSEPSQPLLGSTGNTLSGGGQFMAPQQAPLVGSGALGSGQFSPVSIGAESRFDKYAGVTDPDTRKGIIESVFKDITDPRDLKEIKEKVPWYNISQNPLQTESLFLHEWNESTGVFDTVKGVAKAGMGMLESLPPLVGGAGRLAKDALTGAVYAGSPEAFGKGATLTDEQKKGMTAQQIQEAELSPRDKAIRAARVPADALLMAREDLLNATKNFSEGKAMLWDKARVGFAGATANLGDPSVTPAVSIEEENARREAAVAPAMAEARRNFATRLNAKHIEHMQKEKNPAVLSRTVDELWQDPAIRKYWIDVVEKLMPPAEDAAPGFGGDIEAARANRRAQASEAANAGVQAMITEANRLKEDPEQVGAVAMTTPLNVFGLGGAVVRDFGMLGSRIGRGLRAAGMTQEAKNAMYAADSAALQAQRAATAKISEQPGLLEKPLGNIADTIDRSKAAFENIPKSAKYAASTLIGAGAGALASDDPLIGALEGAGAGAGIQLGGKALLAAPRLGQQLLKAGRMSGAEMGRFEALGKMESASPEVQRFLKWSQKAGGGKALDFIEKNANVFVQHNVSMLPMMVAMGVLEDKDAQELANMWAEFATYGFIHGQVLGGLLGNDPVRIKMDRDAEMRQAQRVMLGFSPETRETVTNLNWDKVIQQSEKRLDRTQKAYFAEMARGANTPETAKAKAAYEFAHQLHRENLVAPPEARQAFEDGIKLSLGKVSNLINGVLTPNSNMNIELLTSSQIIDKMIAANPNFNGVGAPMTVEQALKKNPTANGIMIGRGTAKDGFTMDPAKDTVFVNVENALKKAELSGEAISNVLAHEVAGHGLFGKDDYRKRIAPLFNKMFGTEAVDENGNVQQITPAEPGMSRDDLFGKFFTKYLEGKTTEQVQAYAEAAGVWDEVANDFDKNKIVQLMREETLAEAHAGRFFGDPESPLQQGINWIASRVSSENVKSALNHLYAIAGPTVYKQWTSGTVGVTYSPEVMRAIRNVEREMKKYDGDFTDAEPGEAVAAPITRKDVIKSPEMLNKYFKDTGKFETTPVAVVTDADGKVVQTVDLKDNDAPEGSWVYHQDDATGNVVPNKEKGYGELHPELIQIQVPVGGRITVERKIAYDESTGKPKERKNKETAEFIKNRNQVLRDAIDNAGDPSEIGRFKAIPSKGEGEEEGEMRYTGKMTNEQREAIAALPESIVAASTKDLLFQYDDLLTRDDGTVLDIDYAARLNAKGNYEAFVSRVRQIVPLRLHLSKDGHFYVKAWDLSALRKKVQLYKNYAPGVFEPWGGDVDAFWKEFRTKLLPKLSEKPDIEKIRADIAEGVDPSTFQGPAKEQFDQKVAEAYAKKLNEPAWTALEGDPETQRLKRTIYAKMIGDPNPNVPDVESIPDIPKNKLSRAERKIDKKSPLAQIIKSYRLDAHTKAEENAATHLKYPIPYKARFMPEQEVAPQEEQRPAFGGGILKGLQAVSAKYDPKGTGEVKATVQPAEAQVRFMPEREEDPTMVAPGFYSKAGRVLLDKMPNRASAEQIKGILDPQKGSGVKPDEMKSSGINQFIDATQAEKGYVTKDDIRKWLKEDYAAKFETQTMRPARPVSEDYAFYSLNDGWGNNGKFKTIEEAIQAAETRFGLTRREAEVFVWDTNEINSAYDSAYTPEETKYSSYTLSGGTNYEETVLRMPGVDYRSSHFNDVPNYVAHMRTQDFGNGRLIEELQSDLHQAARKRGYKNEQLRDYNRVREIEAKGQAATPEERKEWTALMNAGAMRQDGVADAPFRKDWPIQLFKHALQKAVADGKEWIGWTGGEAQADRYSLAQAIDALLVRREEDGWHIEGRDQGVAVFQKGITTESELEATIGKELAKKIVENQKEAGDREIYEGVDLKLGGEGMKGFYDTMLPKEIGKYVKQWGAKVEPSSIGNDGIWKINITPEMRSSVEGGQARFLPAQMDAEHAAAHEAGNEEKARELVRKTAEVAGYSTEKFYHGTPTGGFNEFDPERKGTMGGHSRGGFSFTTDKRAAEVYAKGFSGETVALTNAVSTINRVFRKYDNSPEALKIIGEHEYGDTEIDMAPEYGAEHFDDSPEEIHDWFLAQAAYYKDKLPELTTAYIDAAKKLKSDSAKPEIKSVYLRLPDGVQEIESSRESLAKDVWGLDVRDKPHKAFIVNLDDGNRIAYVSDPASIKSADPFTYDNAGKLIPLSKRFNPASADIRFMPSVAVVPERFTGTGKEEERRGRYVEPPKAFGKFNISQYEKGGKFFDAEAGEDLTNKTYENASIAVVNGKPSLVANNEAETTGTGPLFRTNLFKQKAGWKWVSEDAPDTSTIVSVEGQGKHLYALQADFQNGVKMARYADKASEPRLRPTGRGELQIGEQIGTIDIRGKQHPVYDKLTIGGASATPTEGALSGVPKPFEGAQVRFLPDRDEEIRQRMPMSAVDVLHGDSLVLPKPEGKRTNADIAIQLADVAERYHGQKITSSNITPKIENELVANGADEAEAALKASGKNAANWYSTAIQAALKVAGIIHKVLTDITTAKANQFFAKESDPLEAANFALRLPLAITSQNMTVPLNARFAEEQFNIFQQTGKFDPSKEYGGKAKSISANLNLANEMIDRLGGILKLQKFVKQEFTVRELEAAASNALGRKISISGRKDDIVNGAAIFGPKIGQGFLQNLMGKFDPVTIDLWMRRTWGRWTGDVVGDGVTGVRLGRMIKAFRDHGKQLPDSIKRLKTVVRSTGLTEKGNPTKPELTISENVEDRLENDLDFRQEVERFAKESDAEFQRHYALMSAPMSESLAAEVRAAMPANPKAPTQAELDGLDKVYRKVIKEQGKITETLNEEFSNLTNDQKKALNQENPSKPIKKDDWIKIRHIQQKRTEKLKNPEKNLLKPEWAKAAKVIVSELNPIDIPSDQDRMVISRVVNKIRQALEQRGYTVTNADVQAILWYPEKDLWAKLSGKKESNLKQSYDDEFIKIAEQRGLGEQARAVAREIRGY